MSAAILKCWTIFIFVFTNKKGILNDIFCIILQNKDVAITNTSIFIDIIIDVEKRKNQLILIERKYQLILICVLSASVYLTIIEIQSKINKLKIKVVYTL